MSRKKEAKHKKKHYNENELAWAQTVGCSKFLLSHNIGSN